MTEAELSPENRRPLNRESVTSARYSLAYEDIGSKDITFRHVGGPVRLVSYEQHSADQARIQTVLEEKGLIAGVRLDSEKRERVYRVPTAARPIAYDARVESSGTFSYNDRQLFYDLGRLLGGLYSATPDRLVIDGDIGKAVAFVEFTAPNEQALYLVPGIEKIVRPTEQDANPLAYYNEQISAAFDALFDDRSPYFNSGFAQVVNVSMGDQA